MYSECIQITRQFAFCPNAFRIDLYKGCDFGCKYCFANMDWVQHKDKNWDIADINKIEKLFYKAFDTDKESKDILVELLRHHVPLHCGGMSDPFQTREWKFGYTYRLIELSNKYHYPIMFSTKTCQLPKKYFDILNPEIHAFHVSIAGWDDDYIRKWECNTASASKRVAFVNELIDKGFFCGIRIQPIIDIEQCKKLCYNISDKTSYVTLEHFKSVTDTMGVIQAFQNLCTNKEDFEYSEHKLQFRRDVKIKNIETLQKICNEKGILVGVGDNDLHYLSQSKCCCGIDLIGEAFENYLKYNLTYMSKCGVDKNTFIPKCNPRKHINDQKYGLKLDCKQYAEDYIKDHRDYLGDKRFEIEKELFGIAQKKLF